MFILAYTVVARLFAVFFECRWSLQESIMVFFTEVLERIAVLRDTLGEDACAENLTARMEALADDEIVSALSCAGALRRYAEQIAVVGAGVAAARSRREDGHSGLAQSRGHRSTASLLQELTGSSKSDAAKHVRVGQAILEGREDDAASLPAVGTKDSVTPSPAAWHAPLRDALLNGRLSTAQHDAIHRGLGAPPDGGAEAWTLASAELVEEAAHRTVEELAATARLLRDRLDPEGAARRFDERFAQRSFRMWTDPDGATRASMLFDDEAAAWVRGIIDSALRPRRGGPRFVDAEEKAAAEELSADPRTNEQLTYDLLVDVLRAGTLADATTIFGTKQPGVRLVRVVQASADASGDAPGHAAAFAHTEDELVALPAWLATRQACDSGYRECVVTAHGDPLRLGRTQRLFTPAQRLALAVRDGGCRWKGCDRPPSYCEAHHIDDYSRGGRTDVDRGILLCRFHHMQLHHGGWKISRDSTDDFMLHSPDGARTILKPRLALTWTWAGVEPPPRRFRPATSGRSAA